VNRQYVKVQGRDGLVRDTATKAIVNTNKSDFEKYLLQRDTAVKRHQQLEKHEQDINSIKSELSEIKELLLAVLRK
jgi:glutathione peroxidase-family protein